MSTNSGCPGVPFCQNLLAMSMPELKFSVKLLWPAQVGIFHSVWSMPHTLLLDKRKAI